MASLSRIVYPGDGSTVQFNIPFSLGYISQSDVTCQVADEVDGTGAPIYRTLTFITPTLVSVAGSACPVGKNVVFLRTVTNTALLVDFNNGDIINQDNLNTMQLQALMLVQEVLDGRFDQFNDNISFAGWRAVNLADPVDPQDAATKAYVDARVVSDANAAAALAAANTATAAANTATTQANLAASYAGSINPAQFAKLASAPVFNFTQAGLFSEVQMINFSTVVGTKAGYGFSTGITNAYGYLYINNDSTSVASINLAWGSAVSGFIIGGPTQIHGNLYLNGAADNTLILQSSTGSGWVSNYTGSLILNNTVNSDMVFITNNQEAARLYSNVNTQDSGFTIKSAAPGHLLSFNATNNSTGVGTQSRWILGTGIANAYAIGYLLNTTTSAAEFHISVGAAVAKGIQFDNTVCADQGLTVNGYQGYVPKAWAVFGWNGTSVVIAASGGIASITRVSSATYTITFSANMPSVNYTVNGNWTTASGAGGNSIAVLSASTGGTPTLKTVSQCEVFCGFGASGNGDPGVGTASILFVGG